MVVLSFRYYDNKRSAEKKEHKTIEAADKVWTVLYIMWRCILSPVTVTLCSLLF